ncbi:hypothetical protein AMD27_16580 (plasmid) [Acinetobacter sp. TGL-Y2]|nr:hypothetical protein AMD27_16580 [Acinetobacter sp. TGL-Y2]
MSIFNSFTKVLLSRDQFSNLKVAIVFFVLCGCILLYLSENSFFQIGLNSVFHDVSSFTNGFFFNYFLNFSSVFSNITTVCGFIFFIFILVIMINHYANTFSKKYLFGIIVSIFGFYFILVSVVPVVERYEQEYLSGNQISELVYQRDYLGAYGAISSAAVTQEAKNYMTAQVSLEQYRLNPSAENREMLISDANAVNLDLSHSKNGIPSLDVNVLNDIYKGTGYAEQLSAFKKINNRLKYEVYFFAFCFFVSFIVGVYNLIRYRKEIGL